ncbi:MAG: hypothetical protein IKK27_02005 [Alistipes sp.]|nr:hypothetical protein [Rikenellaceae bacterium]MBR2419982.1 hypothetical protein [Rikenellaceae bacterium]MBR3792702.1 hypothetical protein [Alistipes sp.]
MKRYLLLFVLAIFCLPNIANAQDLSATDYKKGRSYRIGRRPTDSHDAYNDYVVWAKNRAAKVARNNQYLDSKPAAEITVDEATGITTITWGDGAMYRGQTYYGEIKGVGTMVYPDGSKYCGQWERDLPNGYGTMLYPDGLAYSANFVNGLPHGKGVVEDADGNKFSARWVYGKLKEKSLKPYKEKK